MRLCSSIEPGQTRLDSGDAMMPVLRSACFAILAASASLFVSTPVGAAGTPVDFNRDIHPILANSCFKCHGPDGKERKGGTKDQKLRLDIEKGAYATYDG